MSIFRKTPAPKQSLPELVNEISGNSDENLSAALFIKLIAFLRPSGVEKATAMMDLLLDELEQHREFQEGLHRIFQYLVNNRDLQSLFAEVGIQPQGSFISEAVRQINHIILPPLPENRTMSSLLRQAFWKKNDYIWVQSIPDHKWLAFFVLIASHNDNSQPSATPFRHSLLEALQKLALSAAQVGLDDHISRQLMTNNALLHPFFNQVGEIEEFIYLVNQGAPTEKLQEVADRWRTIESDCESILQNIKSGTGKYGTSINQSYLLIRAHQQLIRMRIIVRLLTHTDIPEHTWAFVVEIFKSIIESINLQNSVKALYRKNAGMLAYQIAEHKSESGEHYITTTRREYLKFFGSAAAGGFIISFAALIKVLLHHIKMPEFWQYFFYGFNYACAFVTLFVTGATLATKQPAMTASALASGLDSKKNKGKISFKNTALTFGKVWRSQFASFTGNLIVVFPLCYLMSLVWHQITGESLFATNADALKNLHDQNPTKSLAWWYACITGLALFLSGIINGYMDNKALFISLGARIKSHPRLKAVFSHEQLDKLGNYLQANVGGIAGNICLGFMLGYAPLIGSFFGIPFDIRHITISTGYFAFGAETLRSQLPTDEWIWTTIGVLGIGFLNFAVSFGLAFYVAMQSRKLSLASLPKVARYVLSYFFKKPWDFIFPSQKERTAEEIFPETASAK